MKIICEKTFIAHAHHNISSALKETMEGIFCVRPSSREHARAGQFQEIIHLDHRDIQTVIGNTSGCT